MGRPRIHPDARRLNVQLSPPPTLSVRQRRLWDREFAQFPPGYFVPSDMRGLLLYLDWMQLYEDARDHCEKIRAGGKQPDKESHKQLMDAGKMVEKLQRNLRMFPATRTHREIHGSMANDPRKQTDTPAGWRGLMAVESPKPKKGAKA